MQGSCSCNSVRIDQSVFLRLLPFPSAAAVLLVFHSVFTPLFLRPVLSSSPSSVWCCPLLPLCVCVCVCVVCVCVCVCVCVRVRVRDGQAVVFGTCLLVASVVTSCRGCQGRHNVVIYPPPHRPGCKRGLTRFQPLSFLSTHFSPPCNIAIYALRTRRRL